MADKKVNAFEGVAQAVTDAARAYAAQALRLASEVVEVVTLEAGQAIDATSAASKARSPEDAVKAGADYFTAFSGRAAGRAKSAGEAFSKNVEEALAPAQAVARSIEAALAR